MEKLEALDLAGKQAWLAARDAVPKISEAASQALAKADIILYGPGTQHSSLFPSYRIAHAALAMAPAPVKALVVNLQSDHDIQGLSASDIADGAIRYGAALTHILLHEQAALPPGGLTADAYRGALVWRGALATPTRPHVHNGTAVAQCVLRLRSRRAEPSVEIFAQAVMSLAGWQRALPRVQMSLGRMRLARALTTHLLTSLLPT